MVVGSSQQQCSGKGRCFKYESPNWKNDNPQAEFKCFKSQKEWHIAKNCPQDEGQASAAITQHRKEGGGKP